ncbi:MAG: hypothetical protein WA215_03145 [Candidatus Cybelea sp.]
MPDAEWPAVQEFRGVYGKRSGAAQSLSLIDQGLRDMVAKTPALAFVKARKAVPV